MAKRKSQTRRRNKKAGAPPDTQPSLTSPSPGQKNSETFDYNMTEKDINDYAIRLGFEPDIFQKVLIDYRGTITRYALELNFKALKNFLGFIIKPVGLGSLKKKFSPMYKTYIVRLYADIKKNTADQTLTGSGRRRTKRRQRKGGKKSKKNKKRQRKVGKKSKKRSKRRY